MPFEYPSTEYTNPPPSITAKCALLWGQAFGRISDQADLRACFDELQASIDDITPAEPSAYVPGPAGGATEDVEARQVIESILDILEAHGLMETGGA